MGTPIFKLKFKEQIILNWFDHEMAFKLNVKVMVRSFPALSIFAIKNMGEGGSQLKN